MFKGIANYLTRSTIAAQNLKRQKQFLSWEKVFIIALIIDEKAAVNKSELDKFIEGTKKYIEVFYVELNSKQSTFSDWKCLTKKEKTIFNLPKVSFLNEVKEKKYDLVINVSQLQQVFTANLVSQLNSSFKCGNNNLYDELDLIIERNESQNLISYLKEVVKYLEMIRTK